VTDVVPTNQPTIAVLSRDVFFAMRIRTALKQLGYTLALLGSEADLAAAMDASPALAMVDFNTPIDWDVIAKSIGDHADVPVIAFGAHTDTEGFRKAKAAGVARVIANRSLSEQLPDLIARHARPRH
jgi:CheY-like chemotaxis protein